MVRLEEQESTNDSGSVVSTEGTDVEQESITQVAKDYDHMQEYKSGTYVDAKDSVGKW